MGISIESIKDERLRERIRKALGAGGPVELNVTSKRVTAQGEVIAPVGTGQPARPTRIRQNKKPLLNKLEQEWFDLIKNAHPNYPPVRPQAKTFRLCNGVKFTPDLSCSIWPVDGGTPRETCWEIKGPHSWDDAIVKVKMAAHKYPEICWRFVWKQDGTWCEQILLP